MPGSLTKFFDQDYAALAKQHAGKRAEGTLFVDEHFPATNASLGPALAQQYSKVVWKRPHEINANARLLVDGATPQDVVQGHIGNCWLVTACCVLAGNREYLNEVIPDIVDQDKQFNDDKKYAGIMRFRFWRMGKQFEIVIDDTLPVNQETGELVFCRSKAGNEFWASLLEKAFAKLFGNYEKLDAGNSADALVDFTNGVVDEIQLAEQTDAKRLFEQLSHARQAGAMLVCSIGNTDLAPSERDKRSDSGLIIGHAYAITSIARVKHAGFFNFQHFEMIRLRNPWGQGEWKGAWSDDSEEWKKISESDKKELRLVKDDDGEFWMSFEDFIKNFTRVVVCRVVNTAYLSMKKTWKVWDYDSAWTSISGGGCSENESFIKNPQFSLVLTSKAKVIVSLMQEDHRGQKRSEASGENIKKAEKKEDKKEETKEDKKEEKQEDKKSEKKEEKKETKKEEKTKATKDDDEEGGEEEDGDGDEQEEEGGEDAAGPSAASLKQATAQTTSTSGNMSIGFVIMRTEENRGQIRSHEIEEFVFKMTYTNSRQVSGSTTLDPGSYIVIPTTYEAGLTGNFLLRVFADTFFSDSKPLVDTRPRPRMCQSPYAYRITVKVTSAANLVKQDFLGKGADPYVVARYSDVTASCCVSSREEQKAVSSKVIKDSLNPEFDTSFVFFGRTPDKGLINLQIWNKNLLHDTFMGEANTAQSDAMEEGNLGKFVPFETQLVTRPVRLIV